MADVAKDNLPNSLLLSREYPRSPSSTSPASSRRDSLRPSHPGSDSEPPTHASPPFSPRRKRAASLGIDAATEPRLEDLALTSASNISTVSVGEKVCLCQPDPKIPRPRNAFILYRQHYQAQVVALHPGLANPEISKIIGEQWTSQPTEVKNEWKRLADEEKIRHQRQYPDYRYQPRRAGTTNHTRRVSSGEGPIRCPKCNGRYILTPRTPSTPITPGFRSQYDQLFPPSVSQRITPRNMTIDDRLQFSAVPNNTPRINPSHSQIRWRPGSLQHNHAAAEMNSPRERRMSIEMSGSPELKRRRFNNEFQVPHSPSPYDSPRYGSGRPPVSATGYSDGRRTQHAPGPLVQHPKGGMMEPPPRPSPAMHQFSNMSLNSSYDESLRLPPLQTQGGQFGPGVNHMKSHQRADSQARSVEAMVMTIPYINKIRVLSKISPPLAPPGPTSPVQNVRGAVIAVEGADYKLVQEVGNFIQEYLSKEPECLVKTWRMSGQNEDKSSTPEFQMTGMDPRPDLDLSTTNSPYLTYLSAIQSWHHRSSEIKDFITATPSPQSSVSASAAASSPIISPTTLLPTPNANPPPQPSSSSSSSSSSSNNKNNNNNPACAPAQQLPIALLPHGFSLSLSDTYASAIPIADAYAPVDHWQWMATLWRGIVGPDLTIYVKALDVGAGVGGGVGGTDRLGAAASATGGGGAGGGGAGGGAGGANRDALDELARYGGVECRWDVGAVVVRVGGVGTGAGGAGPSVQGAHGGSVEEKTLRRLGFEVLEWVRNGLSGGGGGAGKGLLGSG